MPRRRARGCPCRTASAAPGATRWPTEAGRIEKPTFGSTALGELVRSRFAAGEIDRVELVGLCTDICVISNALLCKAFCPELPVSVDAACCAGVTPENHRNALSAMQCCQIDVLNIAPDAK